MASFKSSFSHLLRAKSLSHIQHNDRDHGCLKRVLGSSQLVLLGIGCIVGAGIFVMTGAAAANYAGPALILSFIVGGVACAFAGLCYAELAAMIPLSGSAYTYTSYSLGEQAAWIIGWCLVLEYGIGASAVAVGWSGYLVSFLRDFGILLSPLWTHATGTIVTLADGTTANAFFNFPASMISLAAMCVLMGGVKQSSFVNAVIVAVKLAVIICFIAVGSLYVDSSNWHPFIPANEGGSKYGWTGILTGAGFLFFAYVGFDAVATASQEAKNPQKNIPVGILGSLLICTVLYIAVAVVLTGIVHYTKLNVPDPIAVAVNAMALPWLAVVVKLGAIMGLSSVILVLTYGLVRILFAIAQDGLLPRLFQCIHPRFATPHKSTLLCGLSIALISGLTPITTLGHLVSLGTLCAFIVVCVGVIYLRKQHPAIERPFRCPLVPWVPMAAILSCVIIITGLPSETLTNFAMWTVLGIVIYCMYGAPRSKFVAPLPASVIGREPNLQMEAARSDQSLLR